MSVAEVGVFLYDIFSSVEARMLAYYFFCTAVISFFAGWVIADHTRRYPR